MLESTCICVLWHCHGCLLFTNWSILHFVYSYHCVAAQYAATNEVTTTVVFSLCLFVLLPLFTRQPPNLQSLTMSKSTSRGLSRRSCCGLSSKPASSSSRDPFRHGAGYFAPKDLSQLSPGTCHTVIGRMSKFHSTARRTVTRVMKLS